MVYKWDKLAVEGLYLPPIPFYGNQKQPLTKVPYVGDFFRFIEKVEEKTLVAHTYRLVG